MLTKSRTITRRPFRLPKLSVIFADLPDMLKLQILEFVGFSPNDPFILDYVCKYKKVCKIVNPLFLREMLDFKVKNPPQDIIAFNREAYMIITPNKIQNYAFITSNNKLVFNKTYNMYIRECNEMTEFIKLIRSNTTYTKQDPIDKSTLLKLYFCDPKSKPKCKALTD